MDIPNKKRIFHLFFFKKNYDGGLFSQMITFGRLAQWLAQLSYTEKVPGSSPGLPTTFGKRVQGPPGIPFNGLRSLLGQKHQNNFDIT